MLYIFIVVLLLFLLFSWVTLGRDIFQPSCLVTLSYIACALCALIMQSQWQYQYHLETFCIIMLGLVVIYIANIVFCKRRIVFKSGSQKETHMAVTHIPILTYSLMLVVQIFSIAIYYTEILRITGGGINISAVMTVFRSTTAYDTEESVSFLATQFQNVSLAIGLAALYIFLKNTLIENINGNIRYLIPVALYLVGSLFTGARFNALIMIAAGLTMFAVLYRKKYQHGFSWKIWIWIIAIILLALFGFYAVRELIGRTTSSSEDADFVEYIATYMGGAVPLFDMYLQDPVASSTIWGKEMFTALNNQLIEWGILNADSYISHLEFRYWNGYNLGNIYTGFRRSLQDFGIVGMMFFQFIFSAIMSRAYNKIKKGGSEFGLILYCLLGYTLMLHGVNDNFYSAVIALGFVARVVLIYIAYLIIVRQRLWRVSFVWSTERRKLKL